MCRVQLGHNSLHALLIVHVASSVVRWMILAHNSAHAQVTIHRPQAMTIMAQRIYSMVDRIARAMSKRAHTHTPRISISAKPPKKQQQTKLIKQRRGRADSKASCLQSLCVCVCDAADVRRSLQCRCARDWRASYGPAIHSV